MSGLRKASRSSGRAPVAASRARTATASARTTPATRRRSIGGPRAISAARTIQALRRRRRGPVERFTASSFTDDPTLGDSAAGEDPVVRAAAVQALGNMNGTALAIDPSNGRILAMVNQKLALSSGAEPCSTIKLAVTLAALDEGLIKRDTPVNLGGHYTLTLTPALAHSINPYFETLGRMMGFERVKHYANQFGLGELAGYNIPGEQLGVYPDAELPAAQGGVGRMCSFGEGISMTPLQLGALVSSIANGGTLYYLQHPQTPEEIASFAPMVKRTLDIAPLIPEMRDGLEGAVDYGTGRALRSSFREFPVLGKTGHLLQQRHPLWMVCLLRRHPHRPHRHGGLPGGRPSHVRPQGRRNHRPALPHALGQQLLRPQIPPTCHLLPLRPEQPIKTAIRVSCKGPLRDSDP